MFIVDVSPPCIYPITSSFGLLLHRFNVYLGDYVKQLRIDRNFCSIHEEITSFRLYTPGNPRSGLRKGVYNLIEVIPNEPNI